MSSHSAVEIRSLLQGLPVARQEPPACKHLRSIYADDLEPAAPGPVTIEQAVQRAAAVHRMGSTRVEDDAVIVSFRGHGVADGVAIWRSGKKTYHMISWYEYLD